MCECQVTTCNYPYCRFGRAMFDKQTPAEKHNDRAPMMADISNSDVDRMKKSIRELSLALQVCRSQIDEAKVSIKAIALRPWHSQVRSLAEHVLRIFND